MRSQRSSRTAAASWRNCYLKVKRGRKRKVLLDKIRERNSSGTLPKETYREREKERGGRERESPLELVCRCREIYSKKDVLIMHCVSQCWILNFKLLTQSYTDPPLRKRQRERDREGREERTERKEKTRERRERERSLWQILSQCTYVIAG